MCFIGVEVEQETSASPPKKNPGSASAFFLYFGDPPLGLLTQGRYVVFWCAFRFRLWFVIKARA